MLKAALFPGHAIYADVFVALVTHDTRFFTSCRVCNLLSQPIIVTQRYFAGLRDYREIMWDLTTIKSAYPHRWREKYYKRDTEIIGAAIYVNLMSLDRLESLNVGSTTPGCLRIQNGEPITHVVRNTYKAAYVASRCTANTHPVHNEIS